MDWKILLQSFGSVCQMVLAALAQMWDQIGQKFVQLGMIFVMEHGLPRFARNDGKYTFVITRSRVTW